MLPRPPRSNLTDILFPKTTLFLSQQPSGLRVLSPGLEAWLVKPTQPTILFDNRCITKGSRLKPLPQERVAGASPWAWSVRRRPTGGECGDERRQGSASARDRRAGA